MKLSELKTKDLVKVLVYGETGVGKTCFAAGFPTPILYLDFDNKISSAARFYSGQERLSQIEVVNLSSSLVENPLNEFIKQVDRLSAMEKSGNYEYRTVVIDSLTTFSSACLQHIVRSNPGINRVKSAQGVQPGMQDYGILKREFQRLIPSLIALDLNVVMLGHITITKDDLTGELVRGVAMDGSFSELLPVYFEEVYRAFVDEKGNYMAQTKSDTKFKCRNQIPGLAATIPLKYESLKIK